MRLKRWESPRRQGRNDKGRGGAARQRQLRKQQQQLRQKLKQEQITKNQSEQKPNQNQPGGGSKSLLPSLFVLASKKNREWGIGNRKINRTHTCFR
ncbi:hypothetical protein [Calothrix sp. NIES-3974]|uniref:hypothetical protein n=1 Tax=Calothrix sp. NIES-3974 TaxID=2005462 RepID=UPI000BBC9A70|nr:hypothetical protein [Calothrix sp. NIES-3974]